ncbi:conserved hypothetical Protein [Photorhabdus asymbiotica]|uniref:Uncharacterized protein n=1 Tax=Photorhabdus asymbiotica subsp. asymbiotica (strain ATCC 43949 / 3105-77) TaxID=553480 RepID=C7BL49_PHOAA|nr:conserved hypothetical Protein [Photorhabdus asymbiotica]
MLSVALVVGFHLPDVIWHPALWSPDFPLLYLSSKDNGKAAIVWPTPARIIRGLSDYV